MNCHIEIVSPQIAQDICKTISADLPEYFGLAEVNQQYFQGVLSRTSFAAQVENQYVGLLTLEFPYEGNGQIYWLGIKRSFHGCGIGTQLIRHVSWYALHHGAQSLTVETLSPQTADINYLKTYHFYQKCGFQPLFNLHPQGYDYAMVYMSKMLNFTNFTCVDLTHTLHPDIATWEGHCGFHHTLKTQAQEGELTFRVQEIKMIEGIGTHMDAPLHGLPTGQSIAEMDLKELIVPWIVLDVSAHCHERYSLLPEDIARFEEIYGRIPPHCFVFVYTGWSQFWPHPVKYRNNLVFPSISRQATEILLERKIVGLGIDTLSPDRPEDGFPVHQLLLSAGKYILENIAHGDKLPPVGSYGLALPIKVKGGCEAPIRLLAMIPSKI